MLRRALFLPPFDELADPRVLMQLGAEAEAAGWHGVFLWDHVMRPDPPRPVADPWICLAAIASVTRTIRIGPMVTPLVRRRPQKLAREIASLDWLSGGRVTVGLGLGVDSGRELSAFGELLDERERGDLLDEGLVVLRGLLSGSPTDFRGEHFLAERVQFLPTPVQAEVPFWMAARTMNRRPLRRAAQAQGLFPIEMTPGAVREALAVIAESRGGLAGFDVVALASSGFTPEEWLEAGATWWFADVEPGASASAVRDVIGSDLPG